MKREKPKTWSQLFKGWWRVNKWMGTQWHPLFVAEASYKAGYRAGKRAKGKGK